MFKDLILNPEAINRSEPEKAKELCVSLGNTFRMAKELKIPTVIIFEGWGSSGKGLMTQKLISELDPRLYKVFNIAAQTEDEKRYHYLKRFWAKLPQYGILSIFDRSWYREISIAKVEDNIPAVINDRNVDDIREFERQLADDGYVIIKFFLHISKEEQQKRFEQLESSKATSWRVNDKDRARNKRYNEYYAAFADMVEKTDFDFAPWNVLDATDRKATAKAICSIVNSTMKKAIIEKRSKDADEAWNLKSDAIDYALAEQKHWNPIPSFVRRSNEIKTLPIKPLDNYDLSLTISDDDYKKRLKELQAELFRLHNKLYRKRVPVIIAFEGWDAAGKGGAIKRLTAGLDPRGYEVIPTAAPTKPELEHQFLWRFWRDTPRSGHIAIFDRTWYGRVMVERLEGFAKQREWARAFDEMNRFELSLVKSGAIVMKFWLHIDPDEQLKRFTDRQNTPEKQWKITAEDWRNRDKIPGYHISVDQMLELTNTEYAPWFVIESNNKKFARIKVLESVISEIKKRLDD